MTWLVVSIVVALRRCAERWTLAIQMVASSATLLAGIFLWHALHSGGMGPAERWLVVGSICAFVALGLQMGVAGAQWAGPLAPGALNLYRVSIALLALAAAAMLASRVV